MPVYVGQSKNAIWGEYMDRRRFLEITGTTTAALLAGCGGGGGGAGTPAPVVPPAPNWSGLASQLQGALVMPGNAQYDQARYVFNSRFDAIMPQAVARCASASDVSAVLAFATTNKIPITPRSGGHNYAGYSTTTGIVIDVGAMNSITINGTTATIGAGARLVDVYDQLTAKGVAIPTGNCESVGIAGITMGGGIGLVDRAYGLTCDNLVSAEIVTADGTLRTCDANTNADLFWALRGGGGGNFGVATSFTFNTHPTADLTTITASFLIDDAVKVMAAWQAWKEQIPDTLWSQVIFSFWNPDVPPFLYFQAVFIGSQSDVTPYWTSFLAATQSTPTSTSINTDTYRNTMLSNCGNSTISQCHVAGTTADGNIQRNAFAASSDFYDNVVPAAGITALQHAVVSGHAAGVGGFVILDMMGGAIDKFGPNDTAFVHRGALFSAEYYNAYQTGTPDATVDADEAWEHNMRTVMAPWSSGRAYVNYIDPLIANWQTAYYGSNYPKLAQVKARYDPNGVFNLPQGVKAG
ncbi:MAG TPA: FAD-binding oxidoreductase [Burkholderiaceae bacterium]